MNTKKIGHYFLVVLLTLAVLNLKAQTVASLWAEYVANPNNHPNIPNNSYAGYGQGTIPIPNPTTPPVYVTASPYNAIPNDNINDQPAIQEAVDAVGVAGGGIVYLPAGTYRMDKPLFIRYNNVIVRGQGSTGTTATILDFKFSMYSMYKAAIDASTNKGSLWWSTGLVWIGPNVTSGTPNFDPGFESWSSSTLASVTGATAAGNFAITVNSAASLSAGMKIIISTHLTASRNFIKYVYGHEATASGLDDDTYVGNCTAVMSPSMPDYPYPAVIRSISGNIIILDRPLRLKIDPAIWPVTIKSIRTLVTESGLENIQIKGYNTLRMGHLVTPTSSATPGTPTLAGWNGVFINKSWNCWVKNIRMVDLECGVLISNSKNCSALNTVVTSSTPDHWYHHPYAFRAYTSDNLIENFVIDGPGRSMHGASVERFSSGNVYSKGLMKVGTFDTHRGGPFDLIKTEITLANDGGAWSGGASTQGPYSGKRNVNWNITQKMQTGYPYYSTYMRKGDNVYEPLQYPMGAFVGINGPMDLSNGEFVPPPLSGGTLGSKVVTALISDSSLSNLYRAELALRKAGGVTNNTDTISPIIIKIANPVKDVQYTAPLTIRLSALVTDALGTISKVEFYSNSTLLHTEYVTPYEYFWKYIPVGDYQISAKATDDRGNTATSESILMSVK